MFLEKVDLHGLRHEEARQATIRAVEDNWDTGNELIIVTGLSSKMQEVVFEVLEEYKLEGQLGGPLGMNAGIITVTVR